MTYDLTIGLSNYRCFGDRPISFRVGPGMTAFIGVNNAGKSALTRFPYYFRGLFEQLATVQAWHRLGQGNDIEFSLPGSVDDPEALFHDRNDRPLEISLQAHPSSADAFEPGVVLRIGRQPDRKPLTVSYAIRH